MKQSRIKINKDRCGTANNGFAWVATVVNSDGWRLVILQGYTEIKRQLDEDALKLKPGKKRV